MIRVRGGIRRLIPIGFAGGDAALYRYVGNGTTVMLDPYGLKSDGAVNVVSVVDSQASIYWTLATGFASNNPAQIGYAVLSLGADSFGTIAPFALSATVGRIMGSVSASVSSWSAIMSGGGAFTTVSVAGYGAIGSVALSGFGLGLTLGTFVNYFPVYGDDRNVMEWWEDAIWNGSQWIKDEKYKEWLDDKNTKTRCM